MGTSFFRSIRDTSVKTDKKDLRLFFLSRFVCRADDLTSNLDHWRSEAAVASMVSCQEFTFDRSVYKSTFTTEWNLVCDRAYLKSVSQVNETLVGPNNPLSLSNWLN